MKKVLLLLLAVSPTVFVSAQTPRFGIKAGMNIANQNVKISYMGMSADRNGEAIVGFHIGGVADIPLSPKFSFRPELLLSGKGSKFKGTDDNDNPTTATIRPYYLEMPLNFVFHHTFPTQLQFFTGFGPSIGYGIFGKGKSNGVSDDIFQDGGYKRFDFGLNLLAGIELKSGLTLSANFTPGLANIYDGEDVAGASDIKFRNTNFGISIGYMFARKAN